MPTNVINVADVVEANGKTWRENNLAIQHNIPLYSLVELRYEGDPRDGLRVFVRAHTRDCDGTPLYGLTADPNLCGKSFDHAQYPERDLDECFAKALAKSYHLAHSSLNGWGEDSLIVIKSGDEVRALIDEDNSDRKLLRDL